MEKTMQDSQKTKDELWNRLWKEFGQLVYMEGMNEPLKRGANGDLVDFIASEISKAKEEMFTEDEVWTLSALVESKIDEIWDTMTLGTEKIVQEQSDDLHRLLSKLTTK